MAQVLQRPQREQRAMLLKVVYTLESNVHHTLVARLPQPITVTTLPPPKVRGARARRDPQSSSSSLSGIGAQALSDRFATAPLKTCLSAIVMASPDLVVDRSKDYILYAVDAVENYRAAASSKAQVSASSAPLPSGIASSPARGTSKSSPPSTRSVLTGKGYFSWALEEPGEGQSVVNGRIIGGSNYDPLFHGHDDGDDEEEEDEETLEVTLRLKETPRASRDQYNSILGDLRKDTQRAEPAPQQAGPSSQLLTSSYMPNGHTPQPHGTITRAVSDPNLMGLPSMQPFGPAQLPGSLDHLAVPSYPSSLPWSMPDSSSPALHQGSVSTGNTPAPEVSTPVQPASSTYEQGPGPSPSTQAQLLTLLQMLQQRQPQGLAHGSDGGSQPVQSAFPIPPLPPLGGPSPQAHPQQQLAEVLGGLAGMMGIALPSSMLPGAQPPTSLPDIPAAVSQAPTGLASGQSAMMPIAPTEAPPQQSTPFNLDEPVRPQRPPPPRRSAHVPSIAQQLGKRFSLDAIAEKGSRKVRKKGGSSSAGGPGGASRSGAMAASSPAPAPTPLSSGALAPTPLSAGAAANASSRAASVDGDDVSNTSATNPTSAPGKKKPARVTARSVERQRRAAAAAAAVAQRDLEERVRKAIAEAEGEPQEVTKTMEETMPRALVSSGGLLPVRKKRKVNAKDDGPRSEAPGMGTGASTSTGTGTGAVSTSQGYISAALSAAISSSHAGYAQSSPIRQSASGSSSRDATKLSSSLGGGIGPTAGGSSSTLATPTQSSSIARFSFPKDLLASSPGAAFDALLSEGDLDFDGFAIPPGLFGSPSALNGAFGALGGGSGSSQGAVATRQGKSLTGRSPSTPLRRSPRKNPTGTKAVMNPYASLNIGNSSLDFFGSDGESPLFGLVNMSPSSDRTAGGSSSRRLTQGLNEEEVLMAGIKGRLRSGSTEGNGSRAQGQGPGQGQGSSAGSSMVDGGHGGAGDGLDVFGSPSAHRAQRRSAPSSGSGSSSQSALQASGGVGTGTISTTNIDPTSSSSTSTSFSSLMMVSPNLNEVDFAALLRTHGISVSGGGGASSSSVQAASVALSASLGPSTGSPLRRTGAGRVVQGGTGGGVNA